MAERKYSVAEIDQMRSSLTYQIETAELDVWTDKHVRHDVEEKLRTYMLNGTDPAELEAAAIEAGRRAAEYRKMRA